MLEGCLLFYVPCNSKRGVNVVKWHESYGRTDRGAVAPCYTQWIITEWRYESFITCEYAAKLASIVQHRAGIILRQVVLWERLVHRFAYMVGHHKGWYQCADDLRFA